MRGYLPTDFSGSHPTGLETRRIYSPKGEMAIFGVNFEFYEAVRAEMNYEIYGVSHERLDQSP